MRQGGVVLYGPPASGKSTLTRELMALDPRFALLRKLKAGNRRGLGEYEFVSWEELAARREAGRLVVETRRYGNAYAIDRCQVADVIEAGRLPIVHMGNVLDLRRLIEGGDWLTVLLWLSREACRARSLGRGDVDTDARLRAWDETAADLEAHGSAVFALHLDSEQTDPADMARQVASYRA